MMSDDAQKEKIVKDQENEIEGVEIAPAIEQSEIDAHDSEAVRVADEAKTDLQGEKSKNDDEGETINIEVNENGMNQSIQASESGIRENEELPSASDLDIIRAQLESNESATPSPSSINTTKPDEQVEEPRLGPQEELNRLRKLVLATRGGKAQLPAGWSDEPNSDLTHLTNSEEAGDDTANNGSENVLEPVLSKAGLTQVSDSEDDEDDDESSESDSSSSDDSSSSGSSSSGSEAQKQQVRKTKAPEMAAYDSEEDDNGEASGSGARGPTTKNEVLEPTLDVPPYTSVPQDIDMRPLGKIHSIVDSVVVVSQDTGNAPGINSYQNGFTGRPVEQEGEYSVLDTGSLLAFEDRNVLGVVYETFGSVQAPLYALRYASSSQINQDLIKIGRPVFYVPGDSSYILTRALRAMGKGSDASNLWDEEICDDEQEFSDDEAEAAFKRDQKAKRAGKHGGNEQEAPKSKKRNAQQVNSNKQPVIRHGLPARPIGSALPPIAHQDADFSSNSRTMPLPYDDDGQASGVPNIDSSYPTQNHSPSLHPSGAASFQHIRPRGGFSHGMRGRGRGRGRGGALVHTSDHQARSQQGASVAAPKGAYNPAFGIPQAGWNGVMQNQQQQQWNLYGQYPQNLSPQQPQSSANWQTPAYGSGPQQQQQPYQLQHTQPQYPNYQTLPNYDNSSTSYDPSQPLFAYAAQTQQQNQQSQYGYGNQAWPSQPYQANDGSAPPTQ